MFHLQTKCLLPSYVHFQLAIVALCAVSGCLCGEYGPDYGYEGGVPGKRPEGGISGSSSHGHGRVVQAAVQTKHSVRYVNVDIPREEQEPQIIEVGSIPLPLIMRFNSASSRIRVHQNHIKNGPSETQETHSEDSPHILKHSVTKPIIQEVSAGGHYLLCKL